MCQELSALHILIHLILLTIAKMRYCTLAPFLDWLMNSEVVTCPKSPSPKVANLGLPSRIWELGFSIAPGIPVTFGYVLAYITFSPRSSEMRSLPYKLSTTQFSSLMSPVKLKWPSAKGITLQIPLLSSARLIKRETSKIRFVKLKRTSAHACTLNLSSAIIKGVWILLSLPIWCFIILSTRHPLPLTYFIPHVMMITILTLL